MASLRVFVCLLGLVVLCHCDCFFQDLEIKDLNDPPKGCVDKDGKQHDFDSEWVRDCMECSCSKEGLSCCTTLPDADEVDIPEECEMVVNKQACSAKVVLKTDKTKECSPN
ncbi:putative beta-microseminoprotein-like [Scophthalmus maximus]|uniref:Putative beta-microseminoprotein-like n=1 Tax=Scophthalmus maximus TaxID=52904 RepID=A0A2U9CC71_SCOMX|nr:beta-microseminoprotein [Scophthalmus maximus]AWP14088.1 putative beta-microseminoprotein-like [Scophthalmus maximus]